MGRELKAFQIKRAGKILDYRLGQELNLDYIRTFFEKKYQMMKLWSGGRHVLGILERDNKLLFLKLATSEGISEVTKNEYNWNEQFNKLVSREKTDFWVPQNIECGLYNKLFYIITDKFAGNLLIEKPARSLTSNKIAGLLPFIIKFSELIQQLNIGQLSDEDSDYKKAFLTKTKAWYRDIPKDIKERYKIRSLFQIVKNNLSQLQKKTRHGDFTPWHLIKLKTGQLGLIDGEHAMRNGVEYYDIGYFIQRGFSILENQDLAERIVTLLIKKGYQMEKLTVILAARAIGGFLDESLVPSPNYELSNQFKNWVIKLNQYPPLGAKTK